MSVEPAEGAGETLARHDSLYGDAEKVSGDRRHGSGVSNQIIHHLVDLLNQLCHGRC